ncbi:MAG: DUF4177 domain-containing protein [SAR202 cluster bacterium]|nr:DUF4177 domain-containing protein [SAR202 cluster bacterium]
MAIWEYMCVNMKSDANKPEKVQRILNELGRQGWELVAILVYADCPAYFKRQKP